MFTASKLNAVVAWLTPRLSVMRKGSMKIFSIIALIVQLILIGGSKYYGYVADTIMEMFLTTPASEIVTVLSTFRHYDNLDSYLGYSAGAIWVMVYIVVNVKKVANTKPAQLAVLLPIVVSLILSFV